METSTLSRISGTAAIRNEVARAAAVQNRGVSHNLAGSGETGVGCRYAQTQGRARRQTLASRWLAWRSADPGKMEDSGNMATQDRAIMRALICPTLISVNVRRACLFVDSNNVAVMRNLAPSRNVGGVAHNAMMQSIRLAHLFSMLFSLNVT